MPLDCNRFRFRTVSTGSAAEHDPLAAAQCRNDRRPVVFVKQADSEAAIGGRIPDAGPRPASPSHASPPGASIRSIVSKSGARFVRS
jgi:hypothetical protein